MRSLLAITVLIGHAPFGPVFVGGKLAVQIFYMISGFLIAHAIRHNPAYADPWAFWANRALRIYPIYFGVLLLTLVYVGQVDRTIFDFYPGLPTAAQVLLAVSNVTIVGQDWVMFSGVADGHLAFFTNFRTSTPQLWNGLLVPQAWTLGVELMFYALAPFVLRNAKLMCALIVLSCAVRFVTMKLVFGWEDPWTYRFFPSELALFLLGALSNRWLLPFWKSSIKNVSSTVWPTLATVTLIAVCLFYRDIPADTFVRTGLLLGLCATLLPLSFIFQQTSRVDRYIGELSYPIYIAHMLVVWVTAAGLLRLGIEMGALPQTLIVIVATLLLSHALNVVIASPIERLRARIRSAPAAA